jgi:hypothetical protein
MTWASVCIWPIHLSYEHERTLAKRLAQLTSITKLRDLLLLPDGYQGIHRLHSDYRVA